MAAARYERTLVLVASADDAIRVQRRRRHG
jgi:hypothetical protein